MAWQLQYVGDIFCAVSQAVSYAISSAVPNAISSAVSKTINSNTISSSGMCTFLDLSFEILSHRMPFVLI